jgi:transposase
VFSTATGEVLGETVSRHASQQFVVFLSGIIASQPKRRETHVICINVSRHKTQRVADFLDVHRNVRRHFTPTYSSRLNHLENWFTRIQRDAVARRFFGEGCGSQTDALHESLHDS